MKLKYSFVILIFFTLKALASIVGSEVVPNTSSTQSTSQSQQPQNEPRDSQAESRCVSVAFDQLISVCRGEEDTAQSAVCLQSAYQEALTQCHSQEQKNK
jgi:hypothetical protein